VLVEVAPLEDLKARAVRRFEITFGEDPPVEDVKGLDNVSEVAVHGNMLSCRVVGSVDPLIKAIATYEVVNVVSHGADLEELFLAYYRGDADAA
jgi:ABC-2 type transport system ATP-binding protein